MLVYVYIIYIILSSCLITTAEFRTPDGDFMTLTT